MKLLRTFLCIFYVCMYEKGCLVFSIGDDMIHWEKFKSLCN